ncbi:CBS domain-containing protein [Rubellimicrobium sp. CFH 75288]|uniref:CBS domain-containing protein n=1 Tax=Rubellimicrobium sp. CFH 75288 TaxID=2697034 RepID=UPI001412BE41|nr:CBS domain-containing protein [Rubellimicrobium sp. CFH 75288]NAZ36030.1 CBS domain-containing protein [Rubellimicrobium sp. CFH 75288]
MLVRQILKSKGSDTVLTICPDATVAEAARMLSERRIGCLVVSRDGATPIGMISERDIVREVGTRGAACLQERVEQLMTARVVTCGCDDQADAVLGQMTEGRFRHLPVMDDGRMVGLVSIGDVVKARLSELAMEKDALEGMIKGF